MKTIRNLSVILMALLVLTACSSSATLSSGQIQTQTAQALAETQAVYTSTPSPTITPKPTDTPTPTATPIPTLGVGSSQVSEKDGMVMVYVPSGEFKMGSNSGLNN